MAEPQGLRDIPAGARIAVLGAVTGAVLCALPVLRQDVPWAALALLAGLYALCEWPARCPVLAGRVSVPVASGSFFPVLLAAAFLLPPAAAALVAVPGALIAYVEDEPRRVRRAWRAAQLALAARAAAGAHVLLDGRAALGGRSTATAPDFPYALVPAGVAALVFCLVLTALDGLILATAERRPARTAWRGLLLRSLAPHCVHGLAGLMMAVLWRSRFGPPAALFVLLPMYISCWVFAQYHRERAAHQATIRALVQAVDIKDRYTRGHSERVGRASELIARELGMEEGRLEVIRFAGILHDVGKLGVPTRVLRKDGPLTAQERAVIELHPEYGHEMVRGIGFLGEARAAILHHHERLDGSGYPYGLAGGQIPEAARVVAVADAFDAMTSTRSYRRARPVAAAVTELERCAGAQFDPRMVAGLVRALSRYGWHVEVTADEPGAAGARGNVPPPRPSAAPEGPGPASAARPSAAPEGPRPASAARPTAAPEGPRPTTLPEAPPPAPALHEDRPPAGSAPRPGSRSSNAPGA